MSTLKRQEKIKKNMYISIYNIIMMIIKPIFENKKGRGTARMGIGTSRHGGGLIGLN